MSRYLFVIPPLMGHINPTLGIGRKLIGRNHDVAWTGIMEIPPSEFPEKGKFFLQESKELTELMGGLKDKNLVSGLESIQFVFEDFFIPLGKKMFSETLRVIDDYKPDVIVSDMQTFAGAFAGYVRGIPLVTSVTNATAGAEVMMEMQKVVEWEQNLILSQQKELGITLEKNVSFSEKLCLVFSTTDFIGSENFPPGFRFVGPIINRSSEIPFDWKRFRAFSYPKILISMGTTGRGEKQLFFEKMTNAFSGKSFTIVAVAERELLAHWPENFIVQPYVPQLALMKELDVVICHGGHNTVCESIAHEVPLIVIPRAYDQFRVAAQVVNSGCGIKIKYGRIKTEQLLNAIHEILAEKKYQNSLHRISASFLKAGGADKAVALLEEFSADSNYSL